MIPVKIYGSNRLNDIFAFIDNGANVSMLETEVAHKLGIHGRNGGLDMQWINQQVSRFASQ